MNDQTLAGAGHNNPPVYDVEAVTRFQTRVNELADAGSAWLNLDKIETEEQAGKANDFFTQVRTAAKEIDEQRKVDKQVLDDKAKQVQDRYREMLAPLDKLLEKLKPALTKYAADKKAREEAEKREREAAARKAREEAEKAAAEAAARNDVVGEAQAEAALKQAQKDEKAAAKPVSTGIASATGGGRTMAMRTTYTAKVENANKAFSFLRDHPEHGPALIREMERLCTAERRKKDGQKEIPGIVWTETQGVA